MSRWKNALVLAIALAFPAVATAGPGTGDTKPVKQSKQRLSEADLATLQHHHDVNLMEIEMGQIAQQRGGPAVKKYAAALVKDHQAADKTAIGLAKARGVTLSSHATPVSDVEEAEHQKQMAMMEKLKTLEGANFDREYLSAMVDGHSAELGYLTVAIADTTDTKLKAHLEKVRPVVEKHADQARDLLAKTNTTKTEDATPGELKSNDAKPPPAKPVAPAPAPPKTEETTPPKPTPYNPPR